MTKPPRLFGDKRQAQKKNKTTQKKSTWNFKAFFTGFMNDSRSQSTPTKRSPKKTTLGKYLFRTFLTLGVWIFGFVMLAGLWFSYDLPDINQLHTSSRKPGVTILAIDGTVIGTYGNLYEGTIKVSELPTHVPQALMSIEDRRFYHHFGIDPIGLIRAAYTNYKANRVVQGGSTITQQLAKNFLQSQGMYEIHDKSLRRKVQEVIMSVWLEWRFTKDQIMTMYLNRVYFGAATYGIEAASRKYFNKSAKDLSVYEAAIIAGLLKAPSRYSPTSHPQRARQRASIVLAQMVDAGYIKSVEAHLDTSPLPTAEEVMDAKDAQYFSDWIFEQVPSIIGTYDQDLIIQTTFDPQMQRHAKIAMKNTMNELAKKFRTTQIAMVSMTPQGAVKAMIGGMNYGKSQFNRALAYRQPGSTFKPFVYLSALEAGFSPDTYFSDYPVSIGGWTPGNFRKYTPQGEITLQQALVKSVNTVTVRIAALVGFRKIIKTARRLGITSDIIADWSICLGAMEVNLLELTGAYATFANKGYSVTPYGILEIKTRIGDVLYQYQNPEPIEVIEPKHLNQMNRMLEEVIRSGTGRNAKINCTVAGKSGSNADKDAWFVGYTSDLVTGVWTGNDNNAPMHQDSTGGRLPAIAFANFMKPIIEGKNPEDILEVAENEEEIPEEVTEVVHSPELTHKSNYDDIIEGDTMENDEILSTIDMDEDLKGLSYDQMVKQSPSKNEDDFGNEPAIDPNDFDALIQDSIGE